MAETALLALTPGTENAGFFYPVDQNYAAERASPMATTPNDPSVKPQVTGSNLDARDQRGVDDRVAARTPQQAIPGQQRTSPGDQLGAHIRAHIAGGQIGANAVRDYVNGAIPAAPGEDGNLGIEQRDK